MAVEVNSQARGESSSRQASGSTQGTGVSRKKSTNQRVQEEKMIGQWRIGRTIGKGSSGRVKIAKHAITGKYAAIKIVPKGLILSSRMSVSEAGARADKVMLGIEREIVIMKLIDHPNVLNLYDVWETSSELYLIMEYVPGGELFDYLVKRGRLPVSEALHYFQQIIHAVDYCHRFNICHRDLKPENLLLDKDKNIKVADFGMAAWEAGERMLETSCGSPHYASPEIVAGKAYHGSTSDIWSCGIILFALLTGRLPFDDDNIRSLLQKVKVGVFEMPDEIKDPARDLLFKMLEKDPERRITMPDILKHPFFVSRPPRPIPGRQLVSPPSLDEVDGPVTSADDIDPDIMGNLKTLWSGASDEEIVSALMGKEKTWEKAIYHLLVKYRNKHLENYNMEDEEDEAARQRRAARKALNAASGSPPKRKGVAPNASTPAKKAPLGENDTVQNTESPAPARPQAPTPKKASTAPVYDSPVPTRPQSKLSPRPPAGPRPPISQRNSSYSSDEAALPGTPTPAIVLQEATPTKEPAGAKTLSPATAASRPQSVIGSPSPGDAPLNVPQVQDAQLQNFFNEVAAQLNTMNIRSSVASGSSGSSAILGTDYQAYLSYLSGAAASRPTSASGPSPSPVEEEETVDTNQFADADDDDTEAASVHSMAMSIMPQHSPLIGLGLGGPPLAHATRPALYPANSSATNPNRWSYASSTTSSRGGAYPPESPMSIHTPTFSPVLSWANPNPGPTPHTQVLQSQRAAPAPPARAGSKPPPRPLSAASTMSSHRATVTGGSPPSDLARDGSYMIITHADTPSADQASLSSRQASGYSAHRQDAFGMLKKKKKPLSIDPVPFSPALSSSSPVPSSATTGSSGPSSVAGGQRSASSAGNRDDSSPKRSWFGNLFSFKPAPATLVSQASSIGETRDKVRKVLFELGVKVAIVEIDGLRGLKCKFEDIKDSTGNVTIKGVRFRVEFARSNAATTGASYNTIVSLTLEKGAQSSFKNIFNSLKASIEDNLAPLSYTPSQSRRPVQPTQNRSYAGTSTRVAPAVPKGAQSLSPNTRYPASAPTTPVLASTPRLLPSPQAPRSAQIPTAIRF